MKRRNQVATFKSVELCRACPVSFLETVEEQQGRGGDVFCEMPGTP